MKQAHSKAGLSVKNSTSDLDCKVNLRSFHLENYKVKVNVQLHVQKHYEKLYSWVVNSSASLCQSDLDPPTKHGIKSY